MIAPVISNYNISDGRYSKSSLLLGRAIIAFLVLGILLLLEPYMAVMLFVVLGHGHCILTNIEQYRQKKYSRSKLPVYIFFMLLALIALYLNTSAFIFFVSIFFLLHNFLDDMKLLQTIHKGYAVLATAPLFLFVSLSSYDTLMSGATLGKAAIPLYVSFAVVTLFILSKKELRSDAYLQFILPVTFLLMTCFFANPHIETQKLFAFIIISHYANWYLHIFQKYKAIKPEKLRPYFFEVFTINFMIILIFAAFMLAYGGLAQALENPFYKVIFAPAYFYVWTFMHLIVTFRSEDYKLNRELGKSLETGISST